MNTSSHSLHMQWTCFSRKQKLKNF